MPTYEYECDSCGHRFEEFQRITDDPLKKCPHCKKNKLRRLLGTGAAIVFKGSGFYQTDYRSDSYRKSAASDQPAGEAKAESTKTSGEGKSTENSDSGSSSSPTSSEAKSSPAPSSNKGKRKPKSD